MDKSILASKTFWVNLIAIGSSVIGQQFGFELDMAAQGSILGVINIILRCVTKSPVVFK